jgi:hypothetical protein
MRRFWREHEEDGLWFVATLCIVGVGVIASAVTASSGGESPARTQGCAARLKEHGKDFFNHRNAGWLRVGISSPC